MDSNKTKNDNSKLNICLISMTPYHGFKAFLESISLRLLDSSCNVTILLINPKHELHIDGVKLDTYKLPQNLKYIDSLKYQLSSFIERFIFRLKRTYTENETLRHNLYHSQLKAFLQTKSIKPKLDLSRFDCVISAEEVNCNYFLAYSVIAKKKIGYIHPDYSSVPYCKSLDKKSFMHLDYVCATSKANANAIKQALPTIRNKIVGIPNPIDVTTIINKSNEPIDCSFDKDVVNLITVCRLDNKYKALDRLLMVAKKLKENGDKFVWRIIGGGTYEDTMKNFIIDNDLQDCVITLGRMNNPIPWIKNSDLFVLQSYTEGYPMSVNEALVVNTPVLVTNFPSSSEQVENNTTGYIVNNNFDSVYEKVHYAINNKNELELMRDNLRHIDKSRFDNIDELLKIVR